MPDVNGDLCLYGETLALTLQLLWLKELICIGKHLMFTFIQAEEIRCYCLIISRGKVKTDEEVISFDTILL